MFVKMPSAEMRSTITSTVTPIRGPAEFIVSKEVEGLVLEIKENLRLSTTTLKALPCSHLSRKSSRASPYRIPAAKFCCEISTCGDSTCLRKAKQKQNLHHPNAAPEDDPYELLQKLLRDGSLVNEAVRRVQRGFATTKQRYFYESDDEVSPVLRFYSQEN